MKHMNSGRKVKQSGFDADKEAFEYFWDFDAFNTRLMNGKLRTQAALLGKARENAIRLAIIFAHAEGSHESQPTSPSGLAVLYRIQYAFPWFCFQAECFPKSKKTGRKWTL